MTARYGEPSFWNDRYACAEDEGSVLSLVDEVLISCQERCLECVPLEHSVLERLCDAKRKELLLALA